MYCETHLETIEKAPIHLLQTTKSGEIVSQSFLAAQGHTWSHTSTQACAEMASRNLMVITPSSSFCAMKGKFKHKQRKTIIPDGERKYPRHTVSHSLLFLSSRLRPERPL